VCVGVCVCVCVCVCLCVCEEILWFVLCVGCVLKVCVFNVSSYVCVIRVGV